MQNVTVHYVIGDYNETVKNEKYSPTLENSTYTHDKAIGLAWNIKNVVL